MTSPTEAASGFAFCVESRLSSAAVSDQRPAPATANPPRARQADGQNGPIRNPRPQKLGKLKGRLPHFGVSLDLQSVTTD